MIADTDLGEHRAYIVGPNHFQNVLFAAYVETYSSWKSYVVDTVAAIPFCSGEPPPGSMAVIYDCFGLTGDHLIDSLLSDIERLQTNCAFVLFNLDRRTGIETIALEFGAQGFFYQDDTVETLLKGLTAIFGGELWVSRQKMTEVILEHGFALRRKQIAHNSADQHDLTRREVEILGLLFLGASNKLISEKLFISPHTVRTHLNHIFRKIKVTNRLSAMVWAGNYLFPSRPHLKQTT